MTVNDVLQVVESIAPAQYAFGFDRTGLQVGDAREKVNRVLCTLDCSSEAVDQALEIGANVVIAHHPLIWDPIKAIDTASRSGTVISSLIKNNIAMIAAHTNWDCAPGGINDTLASRLDLIDVVPFGSKSDSPAYKVVCFVPRDSTEKLLDAISEAGAGQIGLYERCAFKVTGQGTFKPKAGADPAIGSVGEVEQVEEDRLETLVSESKLHKVVAALRNVHPYEEPAFDIVPMKNSIGHPLGRIGSLKQELSVDKFVRLVEENLATSTLSWPGSHSSIKRAAVVGGAGDKEWRSALVGGADVLVTGEVRHDVAIEANGEICIIQAGHYATEQPGMVALTDRLKQSGLDAHIFAPAPGFSGRPR